MQVIMLTEDEYYNMPLLECVKKAIAEVEASGQHTRIQFYVNGVYSYKLGKSFIGFDLSYNLAGLKQWVLEGDICDLQEVFHNVHKDVYGFRPRLGTPAEWRDPVWLRQQIADVTSVAEV